MTILLVAVLGLTAWCLLPLPVAVAVGRAFRDGADSTPSLSAPRTRDGSFR
jgi:hypothetical protein